jgi:hypothetical protein
MWPFGSCSDHSTTADPVQTPFRCRPGSAGLPADAGGAFGVATAKPRSEGTRTGRARPLARRQLEARRAGRSHASTVNRGARLRTRHPASVRTRPPGTPSPTRPSVSGGPRTAPERPAPRRR